MLKRRKFRTWPLLAMCMLGLTGGVTAHTGNPSSNAPSASTAKNLPAAATEEAQTTNLGKINVTAMKQLVKSLQVVKVALNEPFSTTRDKANVVVCRIINGHGHLNVQERMGAVLECGTNSWFMWHRDECRTGGMAACTLNGPGAAAFERKGAWHSMHALNLQQVMALRTLLSELPPPGKGDVVVVDKNGKPMMTLKSNENSADDKN
ncbi:MAG: hypothetical protein WBR15_08130 [Gammaproteobacteria bacterium]